MKNILKIKAIILALLIIPSFASAFDIWLWDFEYKARRDIKFWWTNYNNPSYITKDWVYYFWTWTNKEVLTFCKDIPENKNCLYDEEWDSAIYKKDFDWGRFELQNNISKIPSLYINTNWYKIIKYYYKPYYRYYRVEILNSKNEIIFSKDEYVWDQYWVSKTPNSRISFLIDNFLIYRNWNNLEFYSLKNWKLAQTIELKNTSIFPVWDLKGFVNLSNKIILFTWTDKKQYSLTLTTWEVKQFWNWPLDIIFSNPYQVKSDWTKSFIMTYIYENKNIVQYWKIDKDWNVTVDSKKSYLNFQTKAYLWNRWANHYFVDNSNQVRIYNSNCNNLDYPFLKLDLADWKKYCSNSAWEKDSRNIVWADSYTIENVGGDDNSGWDWGGNSWNINKPVINYWNVDTDIYKDFELPNSDKIKGKDDFLNTYCSAEKLKHEQAYFKIDYVDDLENSVVTCPEKENSERSCFYTYKWNNVFSFKLQNYWSWTNIFEETKAKQFLNTKTIVWENIKIDITYLNDVYLTLNSKYKFNYLRVFDDMWSPMNLFPDSDKSNQTYVIDSNNVLHFPAPKSHFNYKFGQFSDNDKKNIWHIKLWMMYKKKELEKVCGEVKNQNEDDFSIDNVTSWLSDASWFTPKSELLEMFKWTIVFDPGEKTEIQWRDWETCLMFNEAWWFLYYNKWYKGTINLDLKTLLNIDNAFLTSITDVIDFIINLLTIPINALMSVLWVMYPALNNWWEVCYFWTIQSYEFQSFLKWSEWYWEMNLVDYLVLFAWVAILLSSVYKLIPEWMFEAPSARVDSTSTYTKDERWVRRQDKIVLHRTDNIRASKAKKFNPFWDPRNLK